ncbi:TPA_asm: hypothetical protein vir519_00032 [Caudoviricetes sp. vir519]|nr:TPA_asm: hypothetical protein vir519_00032 [Caudoviricetes sp. vir519]
MINISLDDYQFNCPGEDTEDIMQAVITDNTLTTVTQSNLLPAGKKITLRDKTTETSDILYLQNIRSAKIAHQLETNIGSFSVAIEDIEITEFPNHWELRFILWQCDEFQVPNLKIIRKRGTSEIDITNQVIHAELQHESAQSIAVGIFEIGNAQDGNADLVKVGDEIYYYSGPSIPLLKAILECDTIENIASKSGERKRMRCKTSSSKRLKITIQVTEQVYYDTSAYDLIIALLTDTFLNPDIPSTLESRILDEFTFYAGESKDSISFRLTEALLDEYQETWIFWTDATEDIYYFELISQSEVYTHTYEWGEKIISKNFEMTKDQFMNWILGYGNKLDTVQSSNSIELIHEEEGLVFYPHSLCVTIPEPNRESLFGVGINDSAHGIIFKVIGNTYSQVFEDPEREYHSIYSFGKYLVIGHATGISIVDTRAFELPGPEALSDDVDEWGNPGSYPISLITIDKDGIPHILYRQYSSPYPFIFAKKPGDDWEFQNWGFGGGAFDLMYESLENIHYVSCYRSIGGPAHVILVIVRDVPEYIDSFEELDEIIGITATRKVETQITVTFTPGKTVHIIFKRSHTDDMEHMTYQNGVFSLVTCNFGYTSSIVQENGIIYAVTAKEEPYRLVYKYFNGSTWSADINIDTLHEYILVDLVKKNGTFYVAYYDYTDQKLKYAYSTDGIVWNKEDIAEIAGTVISDLKLNVNSAGKIYVSFSPMQIGNANLIIYFRESGVWYSQTLVSGTYPASSEYGANFAVDSEDILNFTYLQRVGVTYPIFYYKWVSTYPIDVLSTDHTIVDFTSYEGQYVSIAENGDIFESITPITPDSWSNTHEDLFTVAKGIETDLFGTLYIAGDQVIKICSMPVTSESGFSTFINTSPEDIITIKRVVNVLYVPADIDLYSFSDPEYYMKETGGDWYYPNWTYRKKATISSFGDDGIREITIHYGSGSDTSTDVYLLSHCKNNFGDVRFADGAGNTLDFWFQDGTLIPGSSVQCFVTLKENAEIHIYYGKEDETSASSFDDTFLLRDSAENGVPGDRWIVSGSPPDIEVVYSAEQIKYGSYSAKVNILDSSPEKVARLRELTGATKGRVRWWQYIPTAASVNEMGLELRATPGSGENRIVYLLFYGDGSNIRYYQGTTWYNTGATWTEGVWEWYEVRFDQGDYSVSLYRYESGSWSLLATGIKTGNWTGELNDYTIRHYSGANWYNYLDNIIAVQENSANLFAWGSEETGESTEGNHLMTSRINAIDSAMNKVIGAWGTDTRKLNTLELLPTLEIWSYQLDLDQGTEVREMNFVGEDSLLILQDGYVSLFFPTTSSGFLNIARVARDLTSIDNYGKKWSVALDTSQRVVKDVDEWVISLLLTNNVEKRTGQITVPLQGVIGVNQYALIKAQSDSGIYPIYRVTERTNPEQGSVTVLDLGGLKKGYLEVFREAVRNMQWR